MLSALPLESVLRYGVSMLGVVITGNIVKKQGLKWNVWYSSGLMAATLAVLSVTQYTILPYQWKDILFTILEPVLVVALARVFWDGQQYLFHYRRGQQLAREQLLSLVLMAMLALYGIPEVMISDVSLTALVVLYWCLLQGISMESV